MAEDNRTTVVKDRGMSGLAMVVVVVAVLAVVAMVAVMAMNRRSPAEQVVDAAAGALTSTGDAVEGAAGAAAPR